MKNDNKGFSLIELIVVIAIMAILVGALAPQVTKYIEKSRVSADTQALGTLYTALTVAYADPDVPSTPTVSTATQVDSAIPSATYSVYRNAVLETLGKSGGNIADAIPLKSKQCRGQAINITIDANGNVAVYCGTIKIDSSGSHVS